MAEKNSFVLQTRLNAVVAKLSDKQAGLLFKSILNYAANGTVANFEDNAVGIAFEFVRQDIDYTAQKYAETCAKRAESGKLGGRPKKANESKESKCFLEKAKKANGFFEKHNDTDNDTDIDNTKEKEVKEKEKPLAIAFDRFLNYRKQIKKPFKSQMSIDECYKRLEKLSGGNLALAEQIVNQSIAQGWQGLFDLKEGANNNGGIDYNGKDADLSKYIEYERKNTKVFYNK